MSEIAMRTTGSQIDQLILNVRDASSLVDLQEARARVEAMRAWSKVHGQVKSMRLDLLRVEVEALVRIVELGGIDTLPVKDRKAAQYLADLTQADRQRMITESGNTTTAAGMCRNVFMAEELAEERRVNLRRGTSFATTPNVPREAELRLARERVADVSAVLAEVADNYADGSSPFTINEMADAVISDAALGNDLDPSVREGVREVCRQAIRSQPIVEIDGTRLPRTITARDDEGLFIRIPVENALLAHLDEMRSLRRDQIAQDQAALDRLDEIDRQLRSIPGANNTSRIGDLVAASLIKRKAS